MGVQHADATTGNRAADAAGLGGAVDAEICVDAVLEQIQGAGTKRVTGAAGLCVGVPDKAGVRLRVALNHIVCGTPRGPFFFHRDRRGAGEFQTRFADADAIAQCFSGGGYKVQIMTAWQNQQLSFLKRALDGHLLRGGIKGG